jgi:hypothetical protein
VHAAIRRWAGGFYTAMALVPDAWSALLEDRRTEVLVAPFVGFFGVEDAEPFEVAEDVDQRLDDHAAFIPRAILILRKLARMRATRSPDASAPPSPAKVGRVPVRLRRQVQALLRQAVSAHSVGAIDGLVTDRSRREWVSLCRRGTRCVRAPQAREAVTRQRRLPVTCVADSAAHALVLEVLRRFSTASRG